MSLIHRLTSQSAQFDAELRTLLAYEASEDASIEHACAEILHRIQHEGDTALLDYTQRFDRLAVEQASALEISKEELFAALDSLPADQRKALEQAAERVRQSLRSAGYNGAMHGYTRVPLADAMPVTDALRTTTLLAF